MQSATGFGFALVLGPALFAVLDPGEAVFGMLVLGLLTNLLVLSEVDGRRSVRVEEIRPLLLAAAPGLTLAVAVLALLSKPVLQIVLGAPVIAAAAVQGRAGRPRPAEDSSPVQTGAVGLASGLLTTSTSVSGPPIVLWLRARGLSGGELRASLAASFLMLNLMGGAVVAVARGGAAVGDPAFLGALLALAVAGHFAGALVFRRADPAGLSAAVLALAAAAGVASLAAGVAGL